MVFEITDRLSQGILIVYMCYKTLDIYYKGWKEEVIAGRGCYNVLMFFLINVVLKILMQKSVFLMNFLIGWYSLPLLPAHR